MSDFVTFEEPYRRIVRPRPPVGAKGWFMDQQGLYVLEEQPGNIFQFSCPHAGSGYLEFIDGVADPLTRRLTINNMLFRMAPAQMGVWHLNTGFERGLIVRNYGGGSSSPMGTIVWYTRGPKEATNKKSESVVNPAGKHRYTLTDKNCMLYEVLVTPPAGNGRLTVLDGTGEVMWHMPSMFAGSFLLEHVYMYKGVTVVLDSSTASSVTCTWIEQEDEVAK
jgi:hypothetical protein